MTIGDWLKTHPYLTEVAHVRLAIDDAVAGTAPLPVPADWDEYVEDFVAGAPLLQSAATIDLYPAGESIVTALDRLSIHEPGAMPTGVVDWLIGDDRWQPAQAGLVRSVGWITLATALRPIVISLSAWKDDDRWLRRYCPTCGSLPAMAQLAGTDPARMRLLTCGRCSTQWRYGRTMCPFCESDTQRLASLSIEGESGLRIDYCESCKGYLKTYAGQGDERVMLADWTSLHVDQLALDRGLQRSAVSLYELEASTAAVYP